MFEKTLNDENLFAEDREKIEQELMKAKMEMETLSALLRRHMATLHKDSLDARYDNFKNSRM